METAESAEQELAAGPSTTEWMATIDEHRVARRTSLATAEIVESLREDRERPDNR